MAENSPEDAITYLAWELDRKNVGSANDFLTDAESSHYAVIRKAFILLFDMPRLSTTRVVRDLARRILAQSLQPGERKARPRQVVSFSLIMDCMLLIISQREDSLRAPSARDNMALPQ